MVALLLTGEGAEGNSVAKRVAACCRIAGCSVQIFENLSEGAEFLRNLSANDNPADAVLIGAGLASPVAVGRKIHQIDPLVQLIFLIDESRQVQLQYELKYAPPPGGHWTQASADNKAALVKTIRDAVKVSAQRGLKTTLDGFNTKIAAPSLDDGIEYRRLVISNFYLSSILINAYDAIISTDSAGKIVSWNRGAERLFGYKESRILGEPIGKLIAEDRRMEIQEFIGRLQSQDAGIRTEMKTLRSDGRGIEIEMTMASVRDETDRQIGVSIIARDVTERKRAEQQIKDALREKESLLKEIHHRVKNNLQIISSLLGLQSAHVKDKQMREAFQECRSRVKSMALIHENLYQSKNIAEIDFAQYIKTLAKNLFRSYRVDAGNITLKIDVKDVLLSVDGAIPCGLIVNELVTNSIKYAFPEDAGGEIRIELDRIAEDKLLLTVSDNGVGLPKDFDFRKTESLGFQLVNILTEQLRGSIEVNGVDGTEIKIAFPC